jgi:hypothetical protein
MKYGFIYITTNKLNNKKYLGMKKYSKGWEKYFGSSKNLLKDISKYGIDNFEREIIEECVDAKTLQDKEIYYLNMYNVINDNSFYNQSIPHKDFRIKGNTNSSKGKTWEDIYGIEGAKFRRENSKLKGKTWEDIYGKEISNKKREKAKEKRSLETRVKMSNSRKGIKYSEETKKKISEGVKQYYEQAQACKDWA